MSDNTRDHDGGNGEFCLMCGRSDKTAGKDPVNGKRRHDVCLQKILRQGALRFAGKRRHACDCSKSGPGGLMSRSAR